MQNLIITKVTDSKPVGKVVEADGTFAPHANAAVYDADAVQYECKSAGALRRLIAGCQSNEYLIASSFPGIEVGKKFRMLSMQKMRELTGLDTVDAVRSLPADRRVMPDGTPTACRILEHQLPSNWHVFDYDAGKESGEWASLTAEQWLARVGEVVMPGISKAPMVIVPSSKGRIVKPDGTTYASSNIHIYTLTDGPVPSARDINLSWKLRGLKSGLCEGAADPVATDTSGNTPGKMWFESAPLCKAEGFRVLPSAARVANADGAPFSWSAYEIADKGQLQMLSGGAIQFEASGMPVVHSMKLDMEVTLEDGTACTFGDLMAELEVGGSVKAGAHPFRPDAMSYNNLIIRKLDGGGLQAHDNGTGTTYKMEALDESLAKAGGQFGQAPLPAAATAPTQEQTIALAALPVHRPQWGVANTLDQEDQASPAQPVVHNLLNKGEFVQLFSQSGGGKTTLLAHISSRIAQGLPVFGRRSVKSKVLIVASEGRLNLKFKGMADYGLFKHDVLIYKGEVSFDNPQTVQLLAMFAAEAGVGHVMFDVGTDLLGSISEYDDNQMRQVTTLLTGEFGGRGICPWFVQHTGVSETTSNRARGSGVIKGRADVSLGIIFKQDSDKEEGLRTLIVEKSRNGRAGYTLATFKIESQDMGKDESPLAGPDDRITAPVLHIVSEEGRTVDAAARVKAATELKVKEVAERRKAIGKGKAKAVTKKLEAWMPAHGVELGTAIMDCLRPIEDGPLTEQLTVAKLAARVEEWYSARELLDDKGQQRTVAYAKLKRALDDLSASGVGLASIGDGIYLGTSATLGQYFGWLED